MADDVAIQAEGLRTLHLKLLRRQWQIVTLQVIATVALVWMYLEVFNTYVVGSIDHTMLLSLFDQFLSTNSNGEHNVPLGDWLTGIGNDGLGRAYMPLIMGILLGGGMAYLSFQDQEMQRRIKLGAMITLIVVLSGRLVLGWFWTMLVEWDFQPPTDAQWDTLVAPISFVISIFILAFYFLPIIMGAKGIWGLSRRAVAWSIGFTLIFLAIHAILTFPIVQSQLGALGTQLISLETQIGEPSVGLLGYDMISEEQFSLIMIAILLMIFQESAFAVIRYLEYAYKLPESCKKDPEYVQQMDNMLNGHLWHTGIILGMTGLATMVALGFHRMLLDMVEGISGSQWAAQVSESIELQLTYGLVISALLFIGFMAALRFVVPWQRVASLIESLIPEKSDDAVVEKTYHQ